jgi:hypothetical protein
MMHRSRKCTFATLIAFFASGSSYADEPKFEFAQKTAEEEEAAKAQGLKAALNAGLLVMGGNSNSITISGGGNLTWRTGANKIAAEATGAYSRSQVLVAEDRNADKVLDQSEIRNQSQTSVQTWMARFRYDRFFGEPLSTYVSAAAGADKLSGKKFYAGGQFGVSYRLYKSDLHVLVTEGGYDLTHERYFEATTASLEVHSARVFLGHTLNLADSASLSSSFEVLTNVAAEETPTGRASALEDTRLIGKSALTAKVWGDISARFSFLARYDNVPAPRPPFDIPFAPGVVIAADKLDTQTELSLIMNF